MLIKIGTRGSKLALWQANYVKSQLEKNYPQYDYELVIIKTKGDKILNKALNKIGDKGLFVKEIEEQLLDKKIDLAVHSLKDMPAILPEQLCLTKTWVREDPCDVLISKDNKTLYELKNGAKVATGSIRRALQLKKLRQDLVIEGIRGNVDTRLKKLFESDLDAIVMAKAGLQRLGLEKYITQEFKKEEMIPACCQGALAIEVRKDDHDLIGLLDQIADEKTHKCIEAERAFMEEMGGSCHVPMGALCTYEDKEYIISAIFGDENGSRLIAKTIKGKDPQKLGKEIAKIIKKEME